MIELVIGLVVLLTAGGFGAHEVYLARVRRHARERPATLEGGGSHLSGRR